MLPAGPNKKKIEKEARRARHSALKKDNSAKRTLHLLFSAPPPLFFFPLRAFLFQICHSFLLSTLSQALAPFLTSSQGRNSHFFKRKASS